MLLRQIVAGFVFGPLLRFGCFFCQKGQQRLSVSGVNGALKSLPKVLDILSVNKTFDP